MVVGLAEVARVGTRELAEFTPAHLHAIFLWIDGDGTVGHHQLDLSQRQTPEVIEWRSYRDSYQREGAGEPGLFFAELPGLSDKRSRRVRYTSSRFICITVARISVRDMVFLK